MIAHDDVLGQLLLHTLLCGPQMASFKLMAQDHGRGLSALQNDINSTLRDLVKDTRDVISGGSQDRLSAVLLMLSGLVFTRECAPLTYNETRCDCLPMCLTQYLSKHYRGVMPRLCRAQRWSNNMLW